MPSNPMPTTRSRFRAGMLSAAILVPSFLLAWSFGRHILATAYAVYDDEGYLLLSYQHYFAGEHLYTQVFSQYGPFNFLAERLLFGLLHLPVTHDAGRLVTLICWLLSATLGGVFIFKLSKNTTLACGAGLAMMLLGVVLANEPGSPQQLVLPLFMLACCASFWRSRISVFVLGTIGALLFFSKINIGVFYFAALAQTLFLELPRGRIRNLALGAMFVYMALGPVFLMRQDLRVWATNYCLLAIACGVLTLVVALNTTASSQVPLRNIVYAVAGTVATAALITGEMIREGMTLGSIAEGVLWNPLRLPRVFELPLQLSTAKVILALAILTSIAVLYTLRNRWLKYWEWVDALRCLTGLCAIVLLAVPIPGRMFVILGPHVRAFAICFLPLGLIPAKGRPWTAQESFPRLFVASLAAAQFLQAYPVAGSQLAIAVSPLLLWAAICIHDGASGLFSILRKATNEFGANLHRQESLLGGLIGFAIVCLFFLMGVWPGHYPGPASHLQGAATLHLRSDQEEMFEALAADLHANCSMLFTMPGMGSLNLWSGIPTPNGLNTTGWTRSLNLGQQQEILQILQANPGACVVYNPALVRFWETTDHELAQLPLARYIFFNMRQVKQIDGYAIFVDPRRQTPWNELAPNRPA